MSQEEKHIIGVCRICREDIEATDDWVVNNSPIRYIAHRKCKEKLNGVFGNENNNQ